jgi:hypothetical protein
MLLMFSVLQTTPFTGKSEIVSHPFLPSTGFISFCATFLFPLLLLLFFFRFFFYYFRVSLFPLTNLDVCSTQR